MRRLARSLLVLIALLAGLRALLYLAYVAFSLTYPFEVYHLEAKMVHLAWRVQAGVRLYPPWQDGPYVSNFFGPCYFALVGAIGRATGAGLESLFLIGRAVSVLSGLLTTLVLGVWIGRRQGARAGLAGALASLGAGPMYGFSIMARPDMTAELLGVSGFFLVLHPSAAAYLAGSGLLILAVMTKQTAGLFLIAAAAALFADGRPRRGLATLLGGPALLASIALGVTAGLEPNFLPCLLGEGLTPPDIPGWLDTLRRLAITSPDLLFFPAVGLVLWNTGKSRAPALSALTVVVLVFSFATSTKRGADLNYFISLRVLEALSVGTLWRAAGDPAARPGPTLTATLGGAVAMLPCLLGGLIQVDFAHQQWSRTRGPSGRSVRYEVGQVLRLAQDPDVHLLTDSGLIDLHRRERAVFADPWLFRMLVATGRISPDGMRSRIEEEYYDYVVTMKDLMSPAYPAYDFGLPTSLVDPARAHYVPLGRVGQFFIYGRRHAAPGSSTRPAGPGREGP